MILFTAFVALHVGAVCVVWRLSQPCCGDVTLCLWVKGLRRIAVHLQYEPWRLRYCVPSKSRDPFTQRHGVTSRKTRIFTASVTSQLIFSVLSTDVINLHSMNFHRAQSNITPWRHVTVEIWLQTFLTSSLIHSFMFMWSTAGTTMGHEILNKSKVYTLYTVGLGRSTQVGK